MKKRAAALLTVLALLTALLSVTAFAAQESGTAVVPSEEYPTIDDALSIVGSYNNLLIVFNGSETLEEDTVIPSNPHGCVTLRIMPDASLTVAEGVTLTNNGIIELNGGSLQVEGSYVSTASVPNVHWGAAYYSTDDPSDFCSLPSDSLLMQYEAWSQSDFEAALDTDYVWLEIDLNASASFPADTLIPTGGTVLVYSILNTPAVLEIPAGVTVTNNGVINLVDPSILQIDGTLVNNGTVKVSGQLIASRHSAYVGSESGIVLSGNGTCTIPDLPTGDLNGSDSLDGEDLLLLTQAVSGISAAEPDLIGDMNADGILDAQDIALLAALLNSAE